MHVLRTSFGSPFGRKARIAIIHLGLADRVDCVPSQTSNPDDPIHEINPLRKMPALLTEDGEAIYDSPVILEFLDHLAGGDRIVPAEPKARFAALTLQALADGLTEAIVLVRYEDRWHAPEQRSESWLAHQQKKIGSVLAWLEEHPPERRTPDVGQIALACALGFYDKHAGLSWRSSYPRLADWLAQFASRVPAYEITG